MTPSNGHRAALLATPDLDSVVLTNGATINTDTGVIINGDGSNVAAAFSTLPAPSGGSSPETGAGLGIFLFDEIVAGDLTVEGSRALVLLAFGPIEIAGAFDVAARADGGPGALGATACARSGNRVVGFVSHGNNGGKFGTGFSNDFGAVRDADGTFSFSALPSGGSNPGSEELIPLRGGCPGGADPASPNAEGGGGGGIQLVSNTSIQFGAGAGITAGGAGGFRADAGQGSAGAGGGSGGGILLEAPTIGFAPGSGLAANGGGGGSYILQGADAIAITTVPASGAGGNTFKGEGGTGAALDIPVGGTGGDRLFSAGINNAVATAAAGGGGGGGLGRIRINTASGDFDAPAGVILSPTPTTTIAPSE